MNNLKSKDSEEYYMAKLAKNKNREDKQVKARVGGNLCVTD
jgi:hypothetical protein